MSCENNPLQKWCEQLIPVLPGVSEPFLDAQLKHVIEDFCRESTAWRGMVTDYSIVPNQREIPLNPVDEQREVLGIIQVYYEGKPLGQVSHWFWPQTTNRPTGWTSSGSDPSVIELARMPSEGATHSISAWVYFKPKCPEGWMPEVLTGTFWEAIHDGVFGRMLQQPDKPYSNQGKADYYLKRYRNKTREARDMASRGHTPNAQNWSYPFFGSKRGRFIGW